MRRNISNGFAAAVIAAAVIAAALIGWKVVGVDAKITTPRKMAGVGGNPTAPVSQGARK